VCNTLATKLIICYLPVIIIPSYINILNYQWMDDSSYRRNFDLDKKNEIHYHSWNRHLKMSKIAKFGCELL
jgi:hypothetical protein